MKRSSGRQTGRATIVAAVALTLAAPLIVVPAQPAAAQGSAVSAVTVAVNPASAGSTATYTIQFTTTTANAGVVYVSAPAGTTFSASTADDTLSDAAHGAYTIDSVTASKSNGSATANTVVVSLKAGTTYPGAGDTLTLTAAHTVNPGPGSHTLTVATGADPTATTSSPYTIAPTISVFQPANPSGPWTGLDWYGGHLSALRSNPGDGSYNIDRFSTTPGGPAPTSIPAGSGQYGDLLEAPDGSYYVNWAWGCCGGLYHVSADGSTISTPWSESSALLTGDLARSEDGATLYFEGTDFNSGQNGVVFSAPLPVPPSTTPTVAAGGGDCFYSSAPYLTAVTAAGACISDMNYGGSGLAVVGHTMYLIDTTGYINRVDLSTGRMVTIAGGGSASPVDGLTALSANLGFGARGLAVDPAGDVFFGTADGARVFEITPDAIMHLVAGGGAADAAPGVAPTGVNLRSVRDLAIDPSGNLYISAYNHNSPAPILVMPGIAAPQTPPGAPQSVSATPGDGTATVNFAAPTSDGGSPITGYTVTVHRDGAGADTSGDKVVSTNAGPVTVTGLTDGTLYDVYVVATNAVGTSPDAAAQVTPKGPDAVLTADVTSGTAPLTVHLDTSTSTIPPNATFTYYCGDSDTPVSSATAATSATCTYERGSPSTGWQAYAVMSDPATSKTYQSVPIAVKVQPAPNTTDNSAAFGSPVVSFTAAADGALVDGPSPTCSAAQPDAQCATVDDATVMIQAPPGTFLPVAGAVAPCDSGPFVVSLYRGDQATLQTELGSNVISQGGFAVSWTPRCALPLPVVVTVTVNSGSASPVMNLALRHALRSSSSVLGFFANAISGFVNDTQHLVSTIDNGIASAAHAVWNGVSSVGSSVWAGVVRAVSTPNGSATNTVMRCASISDDYIAHALNPATPEYTCWGPYTIALDVPTDKLAQLDTAGVISPGAGNVISPGAGNVISPGAGNVIAAGGGNVIAAGGGNVIAAGGGNIVAHDASPFLVQGTGVIAAGGGNVIAAGGGNVIAAGGGNMTFFGNIDPGIGSATPAQSVPPTIAATSTPPTPASGIFSSSPVTVHLAATGAAGTAVKNVNYSATGANPIADTAVAGASADITVTTPGTTTISYYAEDADLNDSPTATLAIDIALPTSVSVAAVPNPAPPTGLLTYTATVSPVPNGGTVSFSDGGTAISTCTAQPVDTTSGEATCVMSSLASGSHQITATYGGDPGYAASQPSQAVTEVVNGTQAITFTAPTGLQYGSADAALNGVASSGLPVAYDTGSSTVCSIVAGRLHVLSAGSCTVTASQAGNGSFDPATPVSVTFDIPTAPLTITASNATMTYGGSLPTVTPAYSGFVNGDTASSLTTVPTCAANATAGTTGCSGAVDPNYTISYVTGTLTVTPASQTITFTAPTGLQYGSADTALNGVASSGLRAAYDTGSSTVCSIVAGKLHVLSAGSCTVTASQVGNSNYSAATPVSVTFDIPAAPLTVTASNATMTYGGSLPTVTPVYTGFVNGDTASSLTTAPTCVANPTAGTTACSGAVDPNYTITYVAGTLTVTPATQTITFTPPSSVRYGAADSGFNAAASSGLVVSFSTVSNPVCSIVNGQLLHVLGAGSCTVTATQAGNSNYSAATPVSVTFDIAPAPLTITASNATMTYGGSLPTVMPAYSGFLNGDTASSLTTAPTCAANTTAGTTVCSGAVDPNYAISYVVGTLTVTPVIPGAATNVIAVAGTAGSAIVTFAAPASDGGSPITGYTLTPSPACAACTGLSGSSTALSIGGLTDGVEYTFTVTAANVVGSGPASLASNGVTPTDAPVNDLSATTAPGGTTARASSDGTTATASGGTGTVSVGGYRSDPTAALQNPSGAYMDVHLSAGNSFTQVLVIDCNAHNATTLWWWNPASNAWQAVTPAAEVLGSCLKVTLNASSSPTLAQLRGTIFGGADPKSFGGGGGVVPTLPGAPTGVTATAGNGRATVSFTAPSSDGGSAITQYTITASPACSACGGLTTSSTSSVVTGLTNGTAYTFTVTATNGVGTGPASSASAAVTPSWPTLVPTGPTRILDTRVGMGAPRGQLGPDTAITLTVPNLPAGTTAVVMNLTGAGLQGARTFISACPAAESLAACTRTSVLNVVPGTDIANMVTVPVGSDGRITLYNLAGHIDLVADLTGYLTSGYTATGPTRILDTRTGTGAPQAQLGPNSAITLTVPNMPAGTSAVVINLTGTGLQGSRTFVSACPAAEALSTCTTTSVLNVVPGTDIANEITVPVGSDGRITLYNLAGHIDLVADLAGYLRSGYTATGPTRILDTRVGMGAPLGQRIANSVMTLTVPNMPAGTTAVVLNLTATGLSGADSFVSACPAAQAVGVCTTTSMLNVVPGTDIANEITVPVGPDGRITLYNLAGHLDLVADLAGYYVGS